MAVIVACDNGARVRGDAGLHLFRNQCPGPVIDVGEDRLCAGDADGVGRFPERIGRRDDLLSRANTVSPQGQQKSKRAARNRDRISAPEIGGKGRLEGLYRRS